MSITFKISFPPGEEQRFLKLVDPTRYARAMSQAINRTAANVAKFGQKRVAKHMDVPVAQLRRRQRTVLPGTTPEYIRRASWATRRKLEASVLGVGRPFNVTRWGGLALYGPDGRQAATRHHAWGTPRILQDTWQLVNEPGQPIVLGEGASFRGVYGPGVAQTLEVKEISVAMQRFTNRRFRHHWRSRLRYAFEQK